MPSIGTTVLSARVKDETFRWFKAVAKEYKTTVPQILDSLAGVTPDHSGALEAFFSFDVDEAESYAAAMSLVDDLSENGFSAEEIAEAFDSLRRELL